MFKSDLIIKGKHANYIEQLTNYFNDDAKLRLFDRNMDVILAAPTIGVSYNRLCPPDTSASNMVKVMADTIIREQHNLKYIFRLVMLMHEKNNAKAEQRIDRAFRSESQPLKLKEAMEIFDKYMLGGVEILHEKLIEPSKTYDDYLINLHEFVRIHNERYFSPETESQMEELCRLASDY